MNKNKYTFLSKNNKIHSDTGIMITELDGFSINNNYKDPIILKGTYFPIRTNLHYGVFLNFYLGVYLQLRFIYKDLKVIIFDSEKYKSSTKNPRNNTIIEDIKKHFNADILNIDTNNYIFDKIILNSNTESPVIPFDEYDDAAESLNEFSDKIVKMVLKSYQEIIKEFSQYRSKEPNKNNIYITRSFINKKYKNKIDMNISKFDTDYAISRIHDPLFDEYLDNILYNNSYNIVDFFNYGFFDQIKIASSAKIYLTIDGCSLLNAVWCDKDTKIIRIIVNKKYKEQNYYFDKIIEQSGNKIYKTIDVIGMNPVDAVDKIIKEISDI